MGSKIRYKYSYYIYLFLMFTGQVPPLKLTPNTVDKHIHDLGWMYVLN